MNDHLIEVLRAMGSPYTTAAATRIEQLEAALREIESFPYVGEKAAQQMALIARAALDHK